LTLTICVYGTGKYLLKRYRLFEAQCQPLNKQKKSIEKKNLFPESNTTKIKIADIQVRKIWSLFRRVWKEFLSNYRNLNENINFNGSMMINSYFQFLQVIDSKTLF
jgi:hypothetical protein